MGDCKHIVGYEEEPYEGQSPVYFGEEVYSLEEVGFYAFCPLCGYELKGTLVEVYQPPARDADYQPFTPEFITREALRILNDSLPAIFTEDMQPFEQRCGDKITIRKPVKYQRD